MKKFKIDTQGGPVFIQGDSYIVDSTGALNIEQKEIVAQLDTDHIVPRDMYRPYERTVRVATFKNWDAIREVTVE